MADINSLSFGCGNTLLANQLNIMADAIRSLITLVETIGDKVGSYIPLSGSEDITGVLAPDTNEGYDLGKSTNRWGTVWASTGGFKTIDFYDLQSPFGKLGELYVGKDTSNNNEAILHFKHGKDNEEIVATRDWVNSLSKINIGSTGSISEELYNNKSNYIKIESSSDNPIVIAGYDENSVPIGIKFGDASTGDVLTVYDGKIYINDTLYGGGTGGVSVLNDLSDVNTSAAHTGWFLMYDGKGWVSNPLPESLIIHPGDVSINEEYYLKYEVDEEHPSGWYSWVERPPGAKELNELNDVEIDDNKLELGQVLVYSQVTDEEHNTCNSWVNKTVSGVLTYDQNDRGKYLKVKDNGTGTEWVNGTGGVSSINNITGTVTITGSGVSTNNNTITITGGGEGLTSGSWANYLNGQTKSNDLATGYLYYTSGDGDNKISTTTVAPGSSTVSITDGTSSDNNQKTLSANTKYKLTVGESSYVFTTPPAGSGLTGIKYQNSNSNVTTASSSSGYITLKAGTSNVSFDNATTGVLKISVSGNSNLTPATDSALGGIKIGYSESNSGSNTNRNYAVKLDNNKAYVNVPWTDSGARTYSSVSGGPTSDQNLTFGGTFKVPYVSLNTNGQLTVVEKTMTMPDSSVKSGVSSVSPKTNGGLSVSPTSGAVSIGIDTGGVTKTMLNNNVGDVYIKYGAITDLISILNDSLNLDIITFENSTDHLLNILKPVAYSGNFTNMYYYYFKGRVLYSSGDGYVDNPIFYIGSSGASFMCRKNSDSFEVAYVNNTTEKIEFKNVGTDTVIKDIISRLRGDTGGGEFNYTHFPKAATNQNHVLNVSNVETLYYFPNNS